MPEETRTHESGRPEGRPFRFEAPASARKTIRNARRAALVWGIFLLALTSWPSPPEIPGISDIPNFDKLCHAVLYGVEGFFLYFSVAWHGRARFSFMRALTIAGTLAVFGTLDEIHQAWIPGRSMEAADAATDALAGFAGALAASAASALRSRRGSAARAGAE